MDDDCGCRLTEEQQQTTGHECAAPLPPPGARNGVGVVWGIGIRTAVVAASLRRHTSGGGELTTGGRSGNVARPLGLL